MLNDLKHKVARGKIEVSEHATKQIIRRNIAAAEITQAIATAQLVEDYPEAQHNPCCLIFGRTEMNRPLHLVVTYPYRPRVRLITAYEPDPALWVDFIIRRLKP